MLSALTRRTALPLGGCWLELRISVADSLYIGIWGAKHWGKYASGARIAFYETYTGFTPKKRRILG